MARTAEVFRNPRCLEFTPLPVKGLLFRGLKLTFLGFDAESLYAAAATAAAAAAASAVTPGNYEGRSGDARRSTSYRGARADALAAHVLLQEMQEKAAEEGARVIEASREGVAVAGLLVCNFAAAFAHLSRLAAEHQQAPHLHTEPHQLVAALGLEPLRLLSPFWLFACLRDRRVYGPDAHPLFRVSAALTHTQPPLQPPLMHQQQPQRCKQRVLLLGCTGRMRRVRRSIGFGCSTFASDSDDGSEEGGRVSVAGHALAMHDAEIIAACVAALGGCCVTAANVRKAREAAPSAAGITATSLTGSSVEDGSVDVVVIGHLVSLYRKSAALDAREGARLAPARFRLVSSSAQTRATAAAEELALLERLQDEGVTCVRLQWLLDAYRFVGPS